MLSAWIVGRLKPTCAVNDVSSFQSGHCCVQQTSLAHNSSSWDSFDENIWMEPWPAHSGVMFVRIYSTFQRAILSTVVLRTTMDNYSWAGVTGDPDGGKWPLSSYGWFNSREGSPNVSCVCSVLIDTRTHTHARTQNLLWRFAFNLTDLAENSLATF